MLWIRKNTKLQSIDSASLMPPKRLRAIQISSLPSQEGLGDEIRDERKEV